MILPDAAPGHHMPLKESVNVLKRCLSLALQWLAILQELLYQRWAVASWVQEEEEACKRPEGSNSFDAPFSLQDRVDVTWLPPHLLLCVLGLLFELVCGVETRTTKT
jgi:hypothetical protein